MNQALNTALGEYLGLIGDPVATLSAAVAAEPEFILGHTTIAALNALGGVPGSAAVIRDALAAADALAGGASKREALHIAGAKAWAAGDIAGAATQWEAAVAADPADLLALRLAHDTHFFLGDAQKLRDVPVAALPAYAPGTRERGFVLGMAAFGLEETGDYAQAEALGREGVGINPTDSWGVHAVAHVLEMQDRAAEGADWLRGLEPHWAPATGLAIHQYWHLGLYLIELGRLDEVLALYDSKIRGDSTMILDLIDAAALLWRLELLGVDVSPRWERLAEAWEGFAEDHVLAFNDLHIALSLAGAGRHADADRLEASLRDYAGREHGTNAQISAALGLPAIQALRAYRAGDYARTAALLAPIYKQLAPVGGSNAQRDMIIQTLGLAAFQSGDIALAREVMAERRRLKFGTPRAWAKMRQAA